MTNAGGAAGQPLWPVEDPVLPSANATTKLCIAGTTTLPGGALLRSRTAPPRADVSTTLCCCRAREVVDGPPASLTRGGKSTIKNHTETRLTVPMLQAK